MSNETIQTAPEHDQVGPLSDLRVVEMGQLLAGPFCGQLLADFGAEVIKLEDPGRGDPMRQWGRKSAQGQSLWWPVVGRNKKSVTCNLRTPEGQQIARDLIATADILIENFRPGTLERWGLSYEELSALNPKLIMVRVTGTARRGRMRRGPVTVRSARRWVDCVTSPAIPTAFRAGPASPWATRSQPSSRPSVH